MNRHATPRALRWLLPAVILLGAIAPAGAVRAQGPDEGALAMLPGFVDDLDKHPDAPCYTLDMTLTLDESKAAIDGRETVRYVNRADVSLDEIVFRLYPNLPSYGGTMTIDGLTVDGEPAEPALDEIETVMHVPLDEPLPPGEAVTLKLDFTVSVPAGQVTLYAQFSYLDGVLALPNAYPMLSVYEPLSGWWTVTEHAQGDAVYSETAFYDVTITAPEDLILATSGTEIDMRATGEGTIAHRYAAPLMRDFVIFGSEDWVTIGGEQDDVTVTLYYDPSEPDADAIARAGLQYTQDTVRIYDEAFGIYPFANLDVVQTPTRAGGIEYPGVFVIADNLWDAGDESFEFVIAHEAAHQWWYSLVGNDQVLDPWLDEALAQFSVAVYIRDLEGEAAYEASIASYRTQYERYVARTDEDEPIGMPVSSYPDNAYFYFVYQKGPVFYATLAEKYGLESVLQALHDYFAAYRYDVAEPADLLESFEQSLSADLDALFEEWVGVNAPVG